MDSSTWSDFYLNKAPNFREGLANELPPVVVVVFWL